MEINIETAVRIVPAQSSNDVICVQANTCNNTIQLGNSQTYPVNYALPMECTQSGLFNSVVAPFLNFLLEGCDVSIVTTGQSSTGKSYTLIGPGFSCASSESDYGIIPRFIRELFVRIEQHKERNCAIHITWSQICGENVQDLISCGSIECKTISDAFDLIQVGMSNIAPKCAHTLFTITLEQQWIIENVIQHRVSTASFADLASSEKLLIFDNVGSPHSIPSDPSLLALQKCVLALTTPSQYPIQVPYNESVLTTLLKDSFGGRAKTLLIACVSPYLNDLAESFYTLQFASRVQLIKNLVTINSYTSNEMKPESAYDVFGLQFAANQLFKLVANAEELFQKLIVQSSLSQNDLEQISQWLMLKQECDECLSETSEPRRSLERIEEEVEAEGEDSCDSEAESENSIEAEDAMLKLSSYMETFRLTTDKLVDKTIVANVAINRTKESANSSTNSYHEKGARGRRHSIHSVVELTSSASISLPPNIDEADVMQMSNKSDETYDKIGSKRKLLRQLNGDIQGCQKQINELENTIDMKELLLQQLHKHRTVKTNARDKINTKLLGLKQQYHNVQSRLHHAGNDSQEKECQKELMEIEAKIGDFDSIRNMTEESGRKVAELENSLHTSRKQLEKLRKLKRKEEKQKLIIENELKAGKSEQRATSVNSLVSPSHWLEIRSEITTPIDDLEALRHEIRNLRRTRELLIEQRCSVNGKSSTRTIINDLEERKMIQYEEAIEAIDLAIEYKNELMCGHELVIATNEMTDKVLLERLMKLNEHEMRVLLHKYFDKVVDLRYSSKKIEVQLMNVECENENLLSRLQNLSHTLQQVRLESERRIVAMQQQHEDKLHIVMRHIANEGGDNRMVSRVLERSKQAALSMQVAGASKHCDNSSIIARFSRYASARHETVPRQLQAASTLSQAKVTRQKNKIIITQSRK